MQKNVCVTVNVEIIPNYTVSLNFQCRTVKFYILGILSTANLQRKVDVHNENFKDKNK